MTSSNRKASSPDAGRRTRAGARFFWLLGSVAGLAACGGGAGNAQLAARAPLPSAASPAEAPATPFTSDAWGIRVDVPPGWKIERRFGSAYLASSAWKAFASPGSTGEAVVALVMPGSDRITEAEIRIGASRAPDEVAHCTQPPSNARPGSVEEEPIDGAAFTTFGAADAAMSHRLRVHALRTLHDGACYAIDLLVFGVDPRVYDPPATPPFSDAEAFGAMRAVIRTFRFMRSPHHDAASASTTAR